MKKIILPVIFILLIIALGAAGTALVLRGVSFFHASTPPPSVSILLPTQATPSPSPLIGSPISDALARITKKPFGIKVSPGNSPVNPERFSGYHSGVDFETFANEQDVDVPIYSVCDGPLILKQWVKGYGGVAIQKCTLLDQAVTVLYGHLRLQSITPAVNEMLRTGDQIAVLGTGYSTQTDGERKHLHLGIHKGTAINFLGYVQDPGQLKNWMDAQALLEGKSE